MENRRIAIVDEQQLFLDGMQKLLLSFSLVFVVTAFNTPDDLLSDLDTGNTYDLIVTDSLMINTNGPSLSDALNSRTLSIPVLFLAGTDDQLSIAEIMKGGASGSISKKVDKARFFQAVETVMEGGVFTDLEDSVLVPVSTGLQYGAVENHALLPKLSGRQLEILRHIRRGMSNKDVALHLSISENTVKSHLKLMFRELGVGKRMACVQKAQHYGLI